MHNPRLNQTWFRCFILVLLILGIFFRFVNLDKKVYWHDEVYTSLRISGYNGEQVVEQLFNGQVIGVQDLLKFQRLSDEKGLKDTIDVLVEHPEHPPLYYLMARFWVQLFGSSVAVTRSLSALISLLVFPCIYWLCWELFESSVVGWMAIALVAVSPFHVLYAQEAREYSLWTVTILLSSASLIKAIKLNTKPSDKINNLMAWGLYTVTLALNFYVSLLSVFIAISNAVYVIVMERFRWTSKVTALILSSSSGLLLFTPWILVIINHISELQSKTNWSNTSVSLVHLLSQWELHLSSIFIDLHPRINGIIAPRILLLLLIFVGYSLYFLYRHTSRLVWLFIFTLIGVTALGLILPDLILGGVRSSVSRYFIPCYLGIQVTIAYWLSNAKFSRRRILPAIMIAVLITVGGVSCAISSQANTWWNKLVSYHNPEIASIINKANRPLVISNNYDINLGNLLSISYLLEPKVQLLLVMEPTIPKIIPEGFSDVFVFNNSESFLSGIKKEHNSKLELALGGYSSLWKLKKVE